MAMFIIMDLSVHVSLVKPQHKHRYFAVETSERMSKINANINQI
jgi:hypothetical protein